MCKSKSYLLNFSFNNKGSLAINTEELFVSYMTKVWPSALRQLKLKLYIALYEGKSYQVVLQWIWPDVVLDDLP